MVEANHILGFKDKNELVLLKDTPYLIKTRLSQYLCSTIVLGHELHKRIKASFEILKWPIITMLLLLFINWLVLLSFAVMLINNLFSFVI